MVRLTAELIARGNSGYTKKKKEESAQQFVKRLTHLYLENKNITEVGEDLSLCRNLVVLYIYDNHLTEVPNLNFNCNLTHLYLQNNVITKITHLTALTKLSKLYLGGNCITVVEGLEKLEQLQELHLENQHLPAGEQLLFDPRSLLCLSGHLEVLNVSGNNLESLADLEILRSLTQLFAADNQLNDMKELTHLLSNWSRLWRLELVGNPLCHKPKYKDRIIVNCRQLGMLDGKEVTDTARQFLRNWHATRESNKKKKDDFVKQASFITDSAGLHGRQGDRSSTSHELPPVNGRLGSGIPGYLMPGLPRKEFEDLLSRNSAGESRGSSKPMSGILRANAPNGYVGYRKTVSSAPVRRRPLRSVSIELFGNLDPTTHIIPL